MNHPGRLPAPRKGATLQNEPNAARMTANRRNALASTGPRTPAGQERASQNALTHGLVARKVLVRGESAEAWEMYRAAVLDDLAPVGVVEQTLAGRIAELLWRLTRAGAAEAALATYAVAEAERVAWAAAVDALDDPSAFAEVHSRADLEAMRDCERAVCECLVAVQHGGDVALPMITLTALLVHVGAVLKGPHITVAQARFAAGDRATRLFTRDQVLKEINREVDEHHQRQLAAHDLEWGDLIEEGCEDVPPIPTQRGLLLVLADAHVLASRSLLRCEAVLRRVRDELARAEGTAGVGPEVEPVRRHEAHLQRQLAATIALLEAARARRTD